MFTRRLRRLQISTTSETRPAVFVYRLVAEGTVEEAILALQSRKQALADALFEGRTSEAFEFDQEAIAELFQPAGKGLSVISAMA